MIVAWLCGFLLLRVARDVDGRDGGSRLLDDLPDRLHPLDSQIGASLPSFALSFALASRRRGSSPDAPSSRPRKAENGCHGRDARRRRQPLDRPGRRRARRGSAAARTTRRARSGCSAARRRALRPLRARRTGRFLLPRLAALGIPLRVVPGERTAAFSLRVRRRPPHDARRRDRRRVDAARRAARRPARPLAARRAAPALGLPDRDARGARARHGGCCSTGTGSCGGPRAGRSSSTPTSTATCSRT